MLELDLMIFDFDGTLVDSKRRVLYSYKKALSEQGYHYRYNDIESKLGGKVQEVVSRLLPKKLYNKLELVGRISKRFDEISVTEGLKMVKLLPHVKQTIRILKKTHRLCVITNADRIVVDSTFKKLSLSDCWDKIIAADDGFKTKEYAINFLIKHFNTTKKRTAYVGDMVRDVDVAKKIGCISIAVPGWHTKQMLKKSEPDFLINSFKDLVKT